MSDDFFLIHDKGRTVARVEKRGDRLYVTAIIGPKAGQSLGIVSGDQAALNVAAHYAEGLA